MDEDEFDAATRAAIAASLRAAGANSGEPGEEAMPPDWQGAGGDKKKKRNRKQRYKENLVRENLTRQQRCRCVGCLPQFSAAALQCFAAQCMLASAQQDIGPAEICFVRCR